MKIHVILIAFILSCLPLLGFSANECTKDGGKHTCLPITPPKVKPNWIYYSATSYTPKEGRGSLSEAVQDFFQYVKNHHHWDLSGVSSFSVIDEEVRRNFWYNNEPIYKRITVEGPYRHVEKNGEVFYTTWRDTFWALKETTTWQCPDATKQVNVYPHPTSLKEAPFVCAIENPQRGACNNGDAKVGNPCSVTTGRKVDIDVDWVSHNSRLSVVRFYDSKMLGGRPWAFNYRAKIELGRVVNAYLDVVPLLGGEKGGTAVLHRQNGNRISAQQFFTDNSIAKDSDWFVDRDLNLRVHGHGLPTVIHNTKTGVAEHYEPAKNLGKNAVPTVVLKRIDYLNGDYILMDYNDDGQLVSATDNRNQQLHYSYDVSGNLIKVVLPNDQVIEYGYDLYRRLISVKRPGYGIKRYEYGTGSDGFKDYHLLKGIIDENGKHYASYTYDKFSRAIETQHAGGALYHKLEYRDSRSIVSDEQDNEVSYDFKIVQGVKRVQYITEDSHNYKRIKYDKAGNVIEFTQNDIINKYAYDESRNLPISEVRAFGQAESTKKLLEWHKKLPVITRLIEGTADTEGRLNQTLRLTEYHYDNHGNLLSRRVTDNKTGEVRQWSFTYDQHNQRLSERYPSGLRSYWKYDDRGNVIQFTDVEGRVTRYSNHTLDGLPQRIISPTGQLSEVVYDDAGRVVETRRTITAPFVKDRVAITTYQYDAAGQLLRVNLPDGQSIQYRYDDAHRLVAITDHLGNRVRYSLNADGNVTDTSSYDPTNKLIQRSQRSYDHLGRIAEYKSNNGQSERYLYKRRHYMLSDALLTTRYYTYDGLDRLISSGVYGSEELKYTYDGLNQLTSVTDSKGNVTTYTYNAFGELTQENSPDSGLTTYQYAKGRLIKKQDAAGRVIRYSYDIKGRIKQEIDQMGLYVSWYFYDAKGRISRIFNTHGGTTTTYAYDSGNRLIEKRQLQGMYSLITRYRYTPGGLLDQLQLPSGRSVNYQYEKGVLTGVAVTDKGKTTQLIDNIHFNANGLTDFVWSQTGQPVSYEYDLDGRLPILLMWRCTAAIPMIRLIASRICRMAMRLLITIIDTTSLTV